MLLRGTRVDEIGQVMALEAGPEAAPFVVQWPAERHLNAIRDAGEHSARMSELDSSARASCTTPCSPTVVTSR